MSKQVIWLMDSDFCMNCGTELADVDGYCWWCWEQLEEEWNRDDEQDVWYDEYGDGDYRAYSIEEARP